MRFLCEEVVGDYVAYNTAASAPENGHFVFSVAPVYAGMIRHFISRTEDRGVVSVESHSPIDVEFWVAGPKRVVDVLHFALREWAVGNKDRFPAQPKQRKGILPRPR